MAPNKGKIPAQAELTNLSFDNLTLNAASLIDQLALVVRELSDALLSYQHDEAS